MFCGVLDFVCVCVFLLGGGVVIFLGERGCSKMCYSDKNNYKRDMESLEKGVFSFII